MEAEPEVENAPARQDKGKQRAISPAPPVPVEPTPAKKGTETEVLTLSSDDEDIKMEDDAPVAGPSARSTDPAAHANPPPPAAPPRRLVAVTNAPPRPSAGRPDSRVVRLRWQGQHIEALYRLLRVHDNLVGDALWAAVSADMQPHRTSEACKRKFIRIETQETHLRPSLPSDLARFDARAAAAYSTDGATARTAEPAAPPQPSVDGKKWTPDQEQELDDAIGDTPFDQIDWTNVARALSRATPADGVSKSRRQCQDRWKERHQTAHERDREGLTDTDWLQPYSSDFGRRWDHREYRLGRMVKAMKGEPTDAQLETLYATFSFAERRDVRAKARSLAEKYKREAVERERVGTVA